MNITIEKSEFGYTMQLFEQSCVATIKINDFEFNKKGKIDNKYFCALKSEKRLEFASLETQLPIVEFFDIWKKLCLNLSSSGIVLPFIEFICEGISFFQTDDYGYQIDLTNCFSRTSQIENVFEKRDKVLFFEYRTFAEMFFDIENKTSWFHGYFYSKVGKEFTHNRLRLKLINFLKLHDIDHSECKDRSKRGQYARIK